MKRVKTILLRFYYDFITINYETASCFTFILIMGWKWVPGRVWERVPNRGLRMHKITRGLRGTGVPARTARDDTDGWAGSSRQAVGRRRAGTPDIL